MSPNGLRIAYLCDMSPLDRNLYSGGNARLYDALTRHAGDVTILSSGWHAVDRLRRLLLSLPEAVSLRARWRMHLALAGVIARGVRAELARGRYDVLFCAYSFQSLYRLVPPYPMVTAFTSDATQTVYRTSEIGGAFTSKFPGGRLLDGWVERCEAEVLRSADLLLWPSDWMCESTAQRYGLDPASAHVVPWGANLDTPPVAQVKHLSADAPLRLLLIGRDWFAKGGPVAFDTMQALRAEGVDARLTVIGCVPPEFHVNEWVTVHPSLNKAVPDEAAQFNRALAEAHFMVQPSYESYGFAFCEASGHGLPSLCLRVGGVPVRDGVNGHALPQGSTPRDFAVLIRGYLDTPDRYAALSRAARTEYETRLNWDAWGQTVTGLLSEAVAKNATSGV